MRFKRKNVLPTVILLLSLIIIVTLIVLNNKKRKSVFDNEYTFKQREDIFNKDGFIDKAFLP